MTARAKSDLARWKGVARDAVLRLFEGDIVELEREGEVVAYLMPARLPITEPIVEQWVRRMGTNEARLRRHLADMAASGRWSWDPITDSPVDLPPLPPFPHVKEDS